jgi:hypothetical protein
MSSSQSLLSPSELDYKFILEKYRKYFTEKKTTTIFNNLSLSICGPNKDSNNADSADDMSESGKTADEYEEDNECNRLNIIKNKKNRVSTAAVTHETNIFRRIENFNDKFDVDNKNIDIQDSNHMYGVDYTFLLDKIINNSKSRELSFNYPGGYVIPIKDRSFCSEKISSRLLFDDDGCDVDLPKKSSQDDCVNFKIKNNFLKCNEYEYRSKQLFRNIDNFQINTDSKICVCDFNALYPSEMQKENLCITTVCYNPKYMIFIDGKLVSPYDKNFINIVCVPIKMNKSYIYVLAFITRPDIKESVTSKMVSTLNKLRKQCKQEMARMKKIGKIDQYNIFNFKQLAVKTVTNSMYGISNSIFRPVFRPVISSLITRSARQSLLRFYLFYLAFFKQQKIKTGPRKVMYGDTDSAFIIASKIECMEIITQFARIPANRNILKLDLERQADCAIFLAKKSYILYTAKPTPTMYTKQIFTKQKSFPSKTFLSQFIFFIICQIIFYQNKKKVSEVDWTQITGDLKKIYHQFNCCKNEDFRNSHTMSKDLVSYKQKSQQLIQLNHINKITGRQFLRGTKVFFSHYNFIFKEGPFYGPIVSIDQKKFLSRKENNASTILIDDMLYMYKPLFDKMNISLSKERVLDLDTGCIVKNILEGVSLSYRPYITEIMNFIKSSVFCESTVTNEIILDHDILEECIKNKYDSLNKIIDNTRKNTKKKIAKDAEIFMKKIKK